MTFDDVLAQVQDLLQREKRVSYRGLKRRFALDDEYLEDLKEELIGAKQRATDEDGRFLVWMGEGINGESEGEKEVVSLPPSRLLQTPTPELRTFHPPDTGRFSAERRQLTVMFCDLVGSTALSGQLDPEELHEVVRIYQATCTEVIRRYNGHIAQRLGDGLLVYFGYPVAHEDDAARAVRTALEIIEALHRLNPRLPHPLHVRLGIHTGLVVIGEIGSSEKREILALGETPNLAARLQGMAKPDTVVVSTATHHLVQGLFECQDLGPQMLKGISLPMSVYQVIGESMAQSRFEVAVGIGLTLLVGREEELGLLQRCWTQAKEGAGQVVLLSGEPGIGKSRLLQALKEQIGREEAIRIEFRCSPYHQNSAFYPILEHLQRLLQFRREETPQAKLAKLQQALARYRFPQTDTLPLLAALLSLPHPENCAPLTLSAQKQKQKTQEVLVAWLIEEAEKAAVYCTREDLHWVDPSTLEALTLFLEQLPTMRVFAVLTFQPDFVPPWEPRSHLTPLTLSRLPHSYVEEMVTRVTGGKALPREVLRQVVSKTDGVPLFVEELTKMLVESGLLRAEDDHYQLIGPLPPLAIPSTLQDSLMARLDRLAPDKEVVQLGATLGREFSYEVLQAASALDEATLQRELTRLVDAELLFQRGVLPQARYVFKHALCQQVGTSPLLFWVQSQLWKTSFRHPEGRMPRKHAEQLLPLPYKGRDLTARLPPSLIHGVTLYFLGELTSAQAQLEEGITLYIPQPHRSVFHGLACLAHAAQTLWALGYPDQALIRSDEAFTLAQEVGQPYSQAFARHWAAGPYCMRREIPEVHIQAEALAIVDKTGERFYEAELYRLKGELVLQSGARAPASENPYTQHLASSTQAEAEACFLKAIDIARKQQAKSLELRAVMSLVRLRQPQTTPHEPRNTDHVNYPALADAHHMLFKLYHWFTEGFDMRDLQEAKALLDELAEGSQENEHDN